MSCLPLDWLNEVPHGRPLLMTEYLWHSGQHEEYWRYMGQHDEYLEDNNSDYDGFLEDPCAGCDYCGDILRPGPDGMFIMGPCICGPECDQERPDEGVADLDTGSEEEEDFPPIPVIKVDNGWADIRDRQKKLKLEEKFRSDWPRVCKKSWRRLISIPLNHSNAF